MKLHLGCGAKYIEGYIHVDKNNLSHIDYVCDLSDLSVFEDESVELIYASHVLEYYSFIEVIPVLKEWYRVLKKNGILRLSVPDFDKLIKVYELTNSNIDRIIGPMFGRMEINDFDSTKLIFHNTVYNRKKLESVLSESGFQSLIDWNWRNVEHSEIDDYSQAYFPHMDKENGLMISLNIEAKK